MSLRTGPNKTSRRNNSDEKYISDKKRDALINQILEKIDQVSLEQDGTIFDEILEDPNDKTKKIPYKVLVTVHPVTQETEFHIFNPNDTANLLGEGGQGKVIVVQNMITRTKVAVKIQSQNGLIDDNDLKRERSNLLKAKRLVGCATEYDSDSNVKATYTLMNFYPGTELTDYLYEKDKSKDKDSPQYYPAKKPLDLLNKLHLIILALKALIWLHKEVKLAHRDVKTANLVVGAGLIPTVINLIDLGSAFEPGDAQVKDKKTILGSFGYLPPEMLRPMDVRSEYNYACDVWAFGVVVAEILSKANYQAFLKERIQQARATDQSSDITVADIKKVMRDVFINASPSVSTSASAAVNSNANFARASETSEEQQIAKINEEIQVKLGSLAILLLDEQPENRPSLEMLEKILSELNMLYLGSRAVLCPAQEMQNEFKRLKRQNTVAALPGKPMAMEAQPRSATIQETKAHKDKKKEEANKKPKDETKPKLARTKSVSMLKKPAISSASSSESLEASTSSIDVKDAQKKRQRKRSASGPKTSAIMQPTPFLLNPTELTENDKPLAGRKHAQSNPSLREQARPRKAKKKLKSSTLAASAVQLPAESEVDQTLSNLLDKLAITMKQAQDLHPLEPMASENSSQPLLISPSSSLTVKDKVVLSVLKQKANETRRRVSNDISELKPQLQSLLQMTANMKISDNPQVQENMSHVKKACDLLLRPNQ